MLMNFSPEIDRLKFAKMAGAKNNRGFSYALNEKIEMYTAGLDTFLSPQLSYRIVEIDSAAYGLVRLAGGIEFSSTKLSRALSRCVEAVCFVATIGDEIETEINRLTAQNRLSDAFILDTMGSLLTEGLVNRFQQDMQSRYRREGKATSLRFSPGYCDWSIEEQKKLFRLFDEDVLEVELSDTCLMSPRKSVSGIFGISSKGSRGWVSAHNPCRECAQKGCTERRK